MNGILVSEETTNTDGQLIAKKALKSLGNVALNQTVTTSVSNNSSYYASKLVDGHYSQAQSWVSSTSSREEWVEIDLHTVRNVTGLLIDTIFEEDYSLSDFRIRLSADGVNWETVVIEHGLKWNGQFKYEIPNREARYVRIEGIRGKSKESPYRSFLREVEVYAAELQDVGVEEIRDEFGNLVRRIETSKEFRDLALTLERTRADEHLVQDQAD